MALLERTDFDTITSPIIFTGSTTINRWSSLESSFPDKPVINHGFGGSQVCDLVYYFDPLVLQHNPSRIFIQEGADDIAAGKSIDIILSDLKTLIRIAKKKLPETSVYLISPKPSPAHWELREQYQQLNTELSKLCKKNTNVTFINVWEEMITHKGKPARNLYTEDGLHLNGEGYSLWATIIAPYLE